MTKDLIKQLISEYQEFVTSVEFVKRDVDFLDGQNYVMVGLRHAATIVQPHGKHSVLNRKEVKYRCRHRLSRLYERVMADTAIREYLRKTAGQGDEQEILFH